MGKYIDLQDSYLSVKEALLHAGMVQNCEVELQWVAAEDVTENGPDQYLSTVNGIVVPGGFGARGVEGMIDTVRYARANEVPYLGLCLGMQVMVVEAARTMLGLPEANSTEFDPNTPDPVIDLMPDQRDITEMGGTMRLGVYPCQIEDDSWAQRAYRQTLVYERHRHRYEVNNGYREAFESTGMWPTGLSPDGRLVEIMEWSDHPFMVGVQFHPEFLSRPDKAHPLFREFIGIASKTLREGGQHELPLVASKSTQKV